MAKRSAISRKLRKLVSERAEESCEYCLISEADTFSGCHIDHVISVKHDGVTAPDNLAYARVACNRNKGSDLGSVSAKTGVLTRFFNPRHDVWLDHFRLEGALITGVTDVGEVTARILKFNSDERLLEREILIRDGRYPSPQLLD